MREVTSIMGGFTRMFLFTWLDDPVAEETPEVLISDLWLEGSDDLRDEAGEPMTGYDGACRRFERCVRDATLQGDAGDGDEDGISDDGEGQSDSDNDSSEDDSDEQ